MKNIILVLSAGFIFFLHNNILAQTYIQLPDSNAYWIWSVAVEHNVSHYEKVIKLDSIDNSVIKNNKKYTKFFPVQNPWDDIPTNVFGLYRSDSAGRAFFYGMSDSGECDYILYDLSRNIGDTVYDVICDPGPFNDVIIRDTCHVMIGNKRLKKVGFSYSGESSSDLHYWIEGIGNTEGLFNPYPLELNSSSLICMSSYDTAWYPSYSLTPCKLFGYSISEINNYHQPSITPNPFTQTTQITLPQTYHHIALALYDIQGKLLLQQNYTDTDKILLQRNKLNNGMYFLKLTLDGKWVETGKIVVSE